MLSFFTESPLVIPLLAGAGVAISCGILGCFVVWRRMAYFGDSLAHSALLGIALGMVTGLSNHVGIALVCLAFAILMVWLQQKKILSTDTLLGILAHGALAIGMVVVSVMNRGHHMDDGHNHHNDPHELLHNVLFGDILHIGVGELGWILACMVVVLVLVVRLFDALLLMTIHEDMAKAEGINIIRLQLLMMLMMTLIVAASIQLVGMLLITSMLIIPAATARQIAHSPRQMAWFSAICGSCAMLIGIFASYHYDTPAGPTIVTAATSLFVLLFLVRAGKQA